MLDLMKPIPQSSGLTFTEEMTAILEHPPESNLVVEAGAGAGKTTTLVEYARKWKRRALYLTFNASVSKEARGRFPPYVAPMTAHSYAYKALNVGKHQSRIVGKIRKNHVREAGLSLTNPFMAEDRMIKAIVSGIENFTNDAGSQLTPKHCGLEFAPKVTVERVMPIIAAAVLRFVNYETSGLPFTHDCYLKQLEMHGVMGAEYDYILVDEAQDLNPILLSLLRRSGRPLILVGDRKQSIYAFRGSIDAMAEIRAPRLPLAQSWRFGAPVDAVANYILSHTTVPPEWKIKGRPNHKTEIEEYEGTAPAKSLILSRTNGRLFEGLTGIKKPFHVIGGFEPMAVQLLSALALSQADRSKIRDPLVMSYYRWEDMVADADDGDDPEVRRIVKIIKEYGNGIVQIIDRLRTLHRLNANDAVLSLSTAHKAKGLESGTVIILDDFPTPAELQARRIEKTMSMVEYDQEFHLLYVAVTRAMDRLLLPPALFSAFLPQIRTAQ